MATPQTKAAAASGVRMDRTIHPNHWDLLRWPLRAKLAFACAALVLAVFVAIKLTTSASVRTMRVPMEHLTIAKVEQGIFHDLIPLRANVVPRETVYIDAVDG